jgi:NitT/TauT family transport system substrate-binding protein
MTLPTNTTLRSTRRGILVGALALGLTTRTARAADRVSVGVLRFVSSGALFLGLEQGHFTAEGIDVDLKFFEAAQPIAVAVASGDLQFGLTGITGGSLNLAGKGGLKFIASQGAEKKGFVGNMLVASNKAAAAGLTSFDKLAGASVAITQVGSTFHYQLGQIAAAKGFDLHKITMKPLQSIPNMVAAVKTGQVDAAILPPHIAGPMVAAGEVTAIGPLSDVADYQYGALLAAPKLLTEKRDMVVRFVNAYRKGLHDYNAALFRTDASGKRIVDDTARQAAAKIGHYVYPADAPDDAARKVIASAPFCDPSGKLDPAGIAEQVAWYKSERLVDPTLDAQAILDLSFVQ